MYFYVWACVAFGTFLQKEKTKARTFYFPNNTNNCHLYGFNFSKITFFLQATACVSILYQNKYTYNLISIRNWDIAFRQIIIGVGEREGRLLVILLYTKKAKHPWYSGLIMLMLINIFFLFTDRRNSVLVRQRDRVDGSVPELPRVRLHPGTQHGTWQNNAGKQNIPTAPTAVQYIVKGGFTYCL